MKCEHCGKEINCSEFVNKMAEFGANLMAASYYNLLLKQTSEKPKSGASIKIENELYSRTCNWREQGSQFVVERRMIEFRKNTEEEFNKKIKELKKHHIEEIKEATKKARKRQTNTLIDLVTESKKTDTKLASLQDQLEYQSSMASLFARKLQEVLNIIDDFQEEHPEIKVTALRDIKNIIPDECDKWNKKKSNAYLFEYVSRLMEKGFQILIKQDCTLKNYDYKLEIKQDGLLYIFNFADIDGNEFIVTWGELNDK